MTNLKILIVNDFANVAFTLQKYLDAQVDIIYLHKHSTFSIARNPLFFVKGKGLHAQVNQIKQLSGDYDVFLCFGWIAASICYLAEVNYIMYFVDSYIDPKNRVRGKISFVKKTLLMSLYKDTLENASTVIAGIHHDTKILQKYRDDAKIIFPPVDKEIFNPDVSRRELKNDKFTFLSPQRIEFDKGHHILWKAIELTKSDFTVLQTDWGSGEYYERMLRIKPSKIQMIPKIDRHDMPSYLVSTDALLGQISMTACGSSEREAALCNKPVFCYSPENYSDNDPFYKESNDPKDIATYIDKIVLDKEFREKLATIQNAWVKKTFDTNIIIQQWKKVFTDTIKTKSPHHVKMRYKIIFKMLLIVENLIHRDLSSIGRNIK